MRLLNRLILHRFPHFAVLALLWSTSAIAGSAYADIPPDVACIAAGTAAEQASSLPANILVSIGMVETGRQNPFTGQIRPWPWTVNADGAGHYFASKEDAEAFVRLAESSGAQDVDVGCFQISLQNHPDAFTSLDEAFDPAANAAYAAVFLNQLKSQTGSWSNAIADYHSATPNLGLPYQRRVLAAWHGLGNAPPGLDDMADAGFAAPDPVVILQAPAARRVRVITMNDLGSPSGRWLPRVITP